MVREGEEYQGVWIEKREYKQSSVGCVFRGGGIIVRFWDVQKPEVLPPFAPE